MQADNYRAAVKESIVNLIRSNAGIFHNVIQVAMQGELKAWSDTVPVGEEHHFDVDLFKTFDDTNIKELVKLICRIDETIYSLMNINAIEVEEHDIYSIDK